MATRWRRKPKPDVGTVLEAVAGIAGAAVGTALPLGTLAKLATGVAAPEGTAVDEWEARLVTAVDRWLVDNKALVDRVGGGPIEGWQERLLAAFDEAGATGLLGSDGTARAAAVELVARAVFVPLTKSGWGAAEAAAGQLVDDLPDLLVEAAGQGGEFLALRRLLSADLDQILSALDELSDRLPAKLGDQAAVATYLAALPGVLGHDPWAHLIDGPTPDLEASFVARRVRVPGNDKAQPVEEVLDRSERMVVLGGPGLGKSWVARHLAIRAAERAAAELEPGAVDGPAPEIPLWVRASSVLDAPADVPPWESVVRVATAGLADRIGADGAAALRARLDRSGGRYLVVLDGLDEAVKSADSERLERLAGTPGRALRILLTSRAGAWRRQLRLDAERAAADDFAHSLVQLDPLSDAEVRAVVATLLEGHDAARDQLVGTLDRDEQLSRFARAPLACVMLCAVVLATRAVPHGRSQLFARVLTLLLRSTWRGEVPDPAVAQARGVLRRTAADNAKVDPRSGLGVTPDRFALPFDPALAPDARAAIDTVAPVVTFDPGAIDQSRRFIHASLGAHLVAEHVAGLDAEAAADRLRDHLWFDPDWSETVPAAIALHPDRSRVLRQLLDVGDASPAWDDVLRLDGFGELRVLLRALARETAAAAWEDPERELILRAAHEALTSSDPSPLRLELVRGGWPDNRSRDQHLAAVGAGDPLWLDRDIAAGIESLSLTPAERGAAAARVADRLAEGSATNPPRAMATLDALSSDGDEFAAEHAAAVAALVDRVVSRSDLRAAQVLIRGGRAAGFEERLAAALVSQIEQFDTYTSILAPDFVTTVEALTDDPALIGRMADRLLALIVAAEEPEEVTHLHGALGVFRADPDRCAIAMRDILLAMANSDSYHAGELAWMLRDAMPQGPPAATVLRRLLSEPQRAWPRWEEACECYDALALAAGPEAVEPVLAGVVDDLASVDLAHLDLLAEVVVRLGAPEPLRARAEAALLDRLDATRSDVLLSAASGVRKIVPSGPARARAAEVVLERAAAADEPALRSALAGAVLWFADRGPTAKAAFDLIAADPHVISISTLYDADAWARRAGPGADEAAALFDALLEMVTGDSGMLPTSSALRGLRELPAGGEQRKRAVEAMLERLRRNPAHHPYDWLLPAAELGASADQLRAANDLVVDAIADMELHDGMSIALGQMWQTVPLTPDQVTAAAWALTIRLSTHPAVFTRSVAALLDDIGPPADARAAALQGLEERGRAFPDERDSMARAMQVLDPQADPFRPEPGDLLEELETDFSLDTAERLAALDPIDPHRRRAIELLVAWAQEYRYGWELDRAEHLADELRVEPGNLRDAAAGEAATSSAVRVLAASARRRCSGGEWRAFLAGLPVR